jgi:hypothetical protein
MVMNIEETGSRQWLRGICRYGNAKNFLLSLLRRARTIRKSGDGEFYWKDDASTKDFTVSLLFRIFFHIYPGWDSMSPGAFVMTVVGDNSLKLAFIHQRKIPVQ